VRQITHLTLLFAAAVSGAALMAVEFAGQRILAIHWGDSVTVWGAAIAIVLGGLTAGYSLGGRLADKYPTPAVLGGAMAAGAVAVLLVAVVGDDLAQSLADSVPGVRSGALLGSIVLLLGPGILLGMTSPIAARLSITDVERSGRRAGDVYAVGSLGSIAGALTATFWLIEALGTRGLLAATAGAVALAAVLVVGRSALAIAAGVLAASSLIAVVPLHDAALGHVDGRILEERDTQYTHLRVSDDGGVRILWLGSHLHSSQRLDNPRELVFAYTQAMQRAMCAADRPIRRVLLLGVGGGTLVRSVRALEPASVIDAVDVDPAVIQAAHRWFDSPTDRVRYIVADARRFLADGGAPYDAILMDAYASDHLPPHLLTREFFALAAERLARGGIFALNLVGRLQTDVPGSVAQTIDTAFGRVDVYDADPNRPRLLMRNLVVLAGDRPEPDRQCLRGVERALGMYGGSLDRERLKLEPGRVLTDDHPPVALMVE
jgi:spermidine synthase